MSRAGCNEAGRLGCGPLDGARCTPLEQLAVCVGARKNWWPCSPMSSGPRDCAKVLGPGQTDQEGPGARQRKWTNISRTSSGPPPRPSGGACCHVPRMGQSKPTMRAARIQGRPARASADSCCKRAQGCGPAVASALLARRQWCRDLIVKRGNSGRRGGVSAILQASPRSVPDRVSGVHPNLGRIAGRVVGCQCSKRSGRRIHIVTRGLPSARHARCARRVGRGCGRHRGARHALHALAGGQENSSAAPCIRGYRVQYQARRRACARRCPHDTTTATMRRRGGRWHDPAWH